MRRMTIVSLLLLLGFTGLSSNASAAVVVGGSNLLSPSDANQLESWLGPNAITLTNIFSSVAGDGKYSEDFHAAVDGKGPTFSVIEAIDLNNAGPIQIIGGYNPQSWTSTGADNYTFADSERTAFLFNLTTSERQGQKLSTDPNSSFGSLQTSNYPNYGPLFGWGPDLFVYPDLTYGTAYNQTYGSQYVSDSIFAGVQAGNEFYVFRMEVFAVTAVVPEPAGLKIWTVLCLTIGGAHWWRKRRDR